MSLDNLRRFIFGAKPTVTPVGAKPFLRLSILS